MKYTEYLARVDTVTVVLDFDEDVGSISLISLKSPEVLAISATKSYEIVLAHPITQLKLSKIEVIDGCLRLNLLVDGKKSAPDSFVDYQHQKWSCSDLKRKTPKLSGNANLFAFKCCQCDTSIIDSTAYKFLDMPSEYWYELMDYWHCHKPHNNSTNEKKYDDLKPPDDHTVLLGINYLLVNQNDQILIENTDVKCANCSAIIGDMNIHPRIFKWKLNLTYGNTVEKFPYQLFIYNLIMDKVNSQAVRKFTVEFENTHWYIWVINVGLDISLNDEVHKQTLKLLYYSSEEHDDEYEPLQIPNDLIGEFICNLKHGTSVLPKGLQLVQMGKKQYFVSNLYG